MSEPTRTYRASFSVEVEITVPEEAVTRVLENKDGWRDQFYDLDERGVVEMLARNCGIWELKLRQLDGWADMPEDVIAHADYDMEDFERVMK